MPQEAEVHASDEVCPEPPRLDGDGGERPK